MTQGSTVLFLFIVSAVSSAEPVCPGLPSDVTVSSQVRSPRESGCAVDATFAISTRHRGERSPETVLTYHAAGRSVIECAEVRAPLSPGGSRDLENTSKPD